MVQNNGLGAFAVSKMPFEGKSVSHVTGGGTTGAQLGTGHVGLISRYWRLTGGTEPRGRAMSSAEGNWALASKVGIRRRRSL